jgi:hypothetical protein
MVVDEAELAHLEEHLLVCHECVERAEQTAVYVGALRAAPGRVVPTGGWGVARRPVGMPGRVAIPGQQLGFEGTLPLTAAP